MATLEEQIKKVQDDIKDAKNKIIKFEALPVDHPDRQRLAELDKEKNLLQEEKNLLQERENLLLKERAALQHQAASAGAASVPVTVTICINPLWKGDSPEVFTTTFKSETDFLEYLRLAQVPGLFFVPPVSSSSSAAGAGEGVEEEDGDEDDDEDDAGTGQVLIHDFSELVNGGFYSHTPAIKEAQKRIQGELRHLQQSREDEMAAALLSHVRQQEPQEEYRLREELRTKLVCKDGKVHEQDIVITGNTKGVLGSHKTHVKGAKPVKEIAQRAKELGELSQAHHMKGTPNEELHSDMRAAFMAEKVEPGKEANIQKACKSMKVMRLQRNGTAIQVVNRMARAASVRHNLV